GTAAPATERARERQRAAAPLDEHHAAGAVEQVDRVTGQVEILYEADVVPAQRCRRQALHARGRLVFASALASVRIRAPDRENRQHEELVWRVRSNVSHETSGHDGLRCMVSEYELPAGIGIMHASRAAPGVSDLTG